MFLTPKSPLSEDFKRKCRNPNYLSNSRNNKLILLQKETKMADENGNNELAENTDHNASGSGFIVNVNQLQSMDIPLRFNRVKTDNGWIINVQEAGRVTVNFLTSMRKLETALVAGDSIERDGDDLIIMRSQPADAYRSQRGTSPLTLSREELLSTTPSAK